MWQHTTEIYSSKRTMAFRCYFSVMVCAMSAVAVFYYICLIDKRDIALKVSVVHRDQCAYQWPGNINHAEQFKSFSDGSCVYSAYYDSRVEQNNVKIIGLADLDIDSHLPTCILWYNQTDCDVMQASVFRVDGFLASTKNPSSDYLCTPRPGQTPTHVTLTYDNPSSTNISLDATLPIGNTRPQRTPSYNLTVCVHAALFHGYPSRNILIEFIEIYRMLGAEKIVLYNASGNANLTSVIDYYSKKGILDIHSWKPPAHSKTHYIAQAALIQECIYRHMYQTHHLALVNLDEFIFPKKHDSLVDYLTKANCKDADEIRFQNVYFPTDKPSPDMFPSNKTLKSLGSVALTHIMKERKSWGYSRKSKHVVRPRAVIVGQIHGVTKLIRNATTYHAPTTEAQTNHYSEWKYPRTTWLDKTAYRFFGQICARLIHARSCID